MYMYVIAHVKKNKHICLFKFWKFLFKIAITPKKR